MEKFVGSSPTGRTKLKILYYKFDDGHKRPYYARVLIHGEEIVFEGISQSHIVEKIMHRDKYTSREEIIEDIETNFK